MDITKIKRKDGDPQDTMRVRDTVGTEWLTRIEWRDATPLGVEGPDTPNMVIHVMDANGEGSVSHSRALTEEELANPEFDPEKVVAEITTDLVVKRSNIIKSESKLEAFRNKVKNDQDINMKKEIK